MSDTHPNAFRLEAQEKRAEALRLNSEADALETKANALDPQAPVEATPVTSVPATEPADEQVQADSKRK